MLFAATVIWGASFFLLKNTIEDVPFLFLLAIRFFGSVVLLGIFCIPRMKQFTPDYIWKGGITGVIYAFAYIVQTIGLKNTTPGKNAFLTAIYCIIVPFLLWVVAKKKPDIFNLAAAALCLTGIGLVSIDQGFTFNALGDGMTLTGGFLFAAHIVCIAILGKGKEPLLFTLVQFVAAGLVMLIGSLAFETVPPRIGTNTVLAIIYLTVFSTCLATIFMNVGIKYTSATSAGIILSLEAVFGVLFSIIFYKETLTARVGAGFALIFIAVLVSETKLSFLKINRKKD